jgi:hypothetical protein
MAASLFVHGTLIDPACVHRLTGKDLPRRPAVLAGFRRIPGPPAFPHIVPDGTTTTPGMLLHGVDLPALERLDHYEQNGRLYSRRLVTVCCDGLAVEAHAYVGDPARIAAECDPDLEPAERLERHLDEEIDALLLRAADAGAADAMLWARAHREVLAHALEEVHRLPGGGLSGTQRAIRSALREVRLPELSWLEQERPARRFAGAYLRLIARLVVLNQVSERIRRDFPRSMRAPEPFCRYTLPLLAALTLLDARSADLEAGIGAAGLDTYRPGRSYLDYVCGAVLLADAQYDRAAAAAVVAGIECSQVGGATPLGAELEFSHLGARAVRARAGADPHLDSLYYFHDFDLARRLWKMGGHRDDHTGATFDEGRARGFLELAFGRRQVGEDYAGPATADVWVLAELIRQAVRFLEIPPHSLHVSVQVEPDRPFSCLQGPEPLFCLLLLGGDLGPDADGVLRERRIFGRETACRNSYLQFSRLKAHRVHAGDTRPAQVAEFTFARLARGVSYEPLILALKGFQSATNPAPLNLAATGTYRRHGREMLEAVKEWAAAPQPVSDAAIGAFLEMVAAGLERERALGNGHSRAYLADGLARIEAALQARNQTIRQQAAPPLTQAAL